MNSVWIPFTDYIVNNYNSGNKIVEVGIGKILEPSNILKEQLKNTKIVCVDINPSNKNIIKDDITNPQDIIYKDSDLIYSIRPPEELHEHILNLAIKNKCDCIIKTFFTEELNYKIQKKFKLINYKKNVFYLFKYEGE